MNNTIHDTNPFIMSLPDTIFPSCLDGMCVKNCKEGFYSDTRHECVPCHHECRSCGGPYFNDCDSCEDDMRLLDGQCISMNKAVHCEPLYFVNGKSTLSCSLI